LTQAIDSGDILDSRSNEVGLELRIVRAQGTAHYLLDESSVQVDTWSELAASSRAARCRGGSHIESTKRSRWPFLWITASSRVLKEDVG
jgi:hypothetical protein